jgi:hypothetical protein
MPVITSANMRQTYSADIRFHQNTGVDAGVIELFQGAPGGESGGYGALNGTGPVVRYWRENDGDVIAASHYASERKVTNTNLGFIAAGAWHNYKVVAVWSHDPSVGRLEFYLDGKLKKTITGRDVNLGPDSNRLPMLKIGLYGRGVGVIDVDNVKAGPSSGGSGGSSPGGGGNTSCGRSCGSYNTRAAVSAPTNVRVVSGQ